MNIASAILEGYIAGSGGKTLIACPYPEDSDLWRAWVRGNERAWRDARLEAIKEAKERECP